MNRMLPIRSASKSQRIRFGSDESYITWAYQRLLRENNKTMRILDVNPNLEVYEYANNVFGLWAENLDGQGDSWCWVIVGPEKAMVIDTAYGLGNLKAVVDELSHGKPVIVANTHDHFDHAYGNCWFDKVYCHKLLVPYLKAQHAHMWDYLFDSFGRCIWVQFDREDLPKFKPYEIVGVDDGYTFDLGGGHEVELIHDGGHAIGHAMYLDKKNRLLFAGDNICADYNHMCGTVDSLKPEPNAEHGTLGYFTEQLGRICARIAEFDYIYPAHHMTEIEAAYVLDVLDTCNHILEDPEHHFDYKVERYGKMRNEKTVRYAADIYGGLAMNYILKKDLNLHLYGQRTDWDESDPAIPEKA